MPASRSSGPCKVSARQSIFKRRWYFISPTLIPLFVLALSHCVSLSLSLSLSLCVQTAAKTMFLFIVFNFNPSLRIPCVSCACFDESTKKTQKKNDMSFTRTQHVSILSFVPLTSLCKPPHYGSERWLRSSACGHS